MDKDSPRRPNILFIFTDQQSAHALGCAGNPHVRTPANDLLAAVGTRFELAHCPNPLCTPCRASLWTGRYPHEVGVLHNAMPIAPRFREHELGVLLSNAGYDCVYGGKWHVTKAAIEEGHGFRSIAGFDDEALTRAAESFLRERGARRADQPFFLVASFDNPHNICEFARGEPLPRGPIDLGPASEHPPVPANFEIPADEPDLIRRVQAANPRLYPTLGWPEERWREYRRAYFRLCEKVDAQIGRILAALRESGLERETLIVFTSDHGDGMGAHRWNQKSLFYDEIIRVPLIVVPPGGRSPVNARVDRDHLVNIGLNLMPTFLDYAQAAPPSGLRGRSLRGLVENPAEVKAWSDVVIAETMWSPREFPDARGRMVRSRRFKYCVYHPSTPAEQLFDLDADPGETRSLVDDPSYANVLREHRARLASWARETGDEFPVSF